MKEENQAPAQSDPLAHAVGARITRLREERELSSSELARLTVMDVNYLWRIEAGRQNLSLRNVARLAKALGVTLSELFETVDVTEVEFGRRPYIRATRVD